MTRRFRRARPLVVAASVVALAAAGSSALLGPGLGTASSHREAPLVAGDPQVDDTDLYAFVSPDKPDTVTLIANWYPFQEPNGGPNFYPWATDARYNLNVDNDGDAKPDVVYSWTFANHYRDDAGQFLTNTGVVKNLDDPTLNFYQTYDTTVTTGVTAGGATTTLASGYTAAPSFAGLASMPDYAALRAQAVRDLPGGAREYVGPADDSFFLDLRVFDLLYGTNLKESGQDTLTGYNVNTIAIQVPKTALAINGDATANPVIGVWTTTERKGASVTGDPGTATYRQVSRLGNPLVNEVVVPLKYKDAFNGLAPDLDHTVAPVVEKVLDPIVPHLVDGIYKIPAPATPRNDLFEIFLTGICKECKAPDGTVALPIDLNSQLLNRDGKKGAEFVPSEMLRLNMGIAPTASPDRLGVLAQDLAGFPNGRRLTDDVVDIALQAVEGAAQTGTLVQALAAGDGVDVNDLAFGSTFPYVALPHGTSVNAALTAAGDTNGSGGSASGAPAAGAADTGDDDNSPVPVILAFVVGLVAAGVGATVLRRKSA